MSPTVVQVARPAPFTGVGLPSPRLALSSDLPVPEAQAASCVLARHDDGGAADRRTVPVTPLDRPLSLFDREEPPRVAAGRGDDGSTLEDLVLGAWEDLSSPRPAACPVCRGDMVARYGAGPAAPRQAAAQAPRQAAAQAVGGRCLDCGSELS